MKYYDKLISGWDVIKNDFIYVGVLRRIDVSRNLGRSGFRPFVIIHHLGKGGCTATHRGTIAANDREQVVERLVLRPVRGEHGSDGMHRGGFPRFWNRRCRANRVKVCDLSGILLKPF